MSIVGKDFEIQKRNINTSQIGIICEGINRIRFIQNRVADKGNFVLHLLANQEQNNKDHENQGLFNFITTSSSSCIRRAPLSQLRNRDQQKFVNIVQTNHEKVRKVKKQTKDLHLAFQLRQKEEMIRKLQNKRRIQKQMQLGRTKIKEFLTHRNKSVKEFKGQLMQINKRKIEEGQGSLNMYENKVLMGQRIKELIIQKLESQESRMKQH